MLFNSYAFIFFFLPAALAGYFILNQFHFYRYATLFLFISSLLFYGCWNPIYLPLILLSIFINYLIGMELTKKYGSTQRKLFLWVGIAFNLVLLGYYKYSDFFIANVNYFLKNHISLMHVILPLGISFFTFTQVAFLVDTYKRKVKESNLLNYGLFVTYFPHLLAGPIIHHAEIMPQFSNLDKKKINYKNLVIGLMVFSIGLFKKACIADTLASWVDNGYHHLTYLTTPEAWLLTFCYTLQLYFDFSGYCDMAIGCSLMLNIHLPENFNSPYKALNIQDFWRRWHMTLSRWLRDYVYIPLGGNRVSEPLIYINLVATFLIGGIWHGAGWTFVVWGMLHGFGVAIHRAWQKTKIKIHSSMSWFITFMFVNIAWVFFHSNSLPDALYLLKKMFDFTFLKFPFSKEEFYYQFAPGDLEAEILRIIILFPIFLFLCFFSKNSIEIKSAYVPCLKWNLYASLALSIGILCLTRITTFIYFQF